MQQQKKQYVCNKEFTSEQRQADEFHGICEVQNRKLFIGFNSMRFSFDYDYYYESECMYQMVKQDKNNTELKGTLHQEGNKLVATITSGAQRAEDGVTGKTIYCGNNLTGSFDFIQDEESLKIQAVNLQPQGIDRHHCILLPNQIYRAAKQ